MTTSLGHFPKRSGKVRDVYDLGDRLLIVATDRISAYDVVMPNGIPDKGRILTQISVFWFDLLGSVVSNHLISVSLQDVPEAVRSDEIDGRMMLCKKASVVPIECIVRGYLAGSGWEEYKKSGTVCGVELPVKLKPFSPLPEPIFTASTKAVTGHDENITFEQVAERVGAKLAGELRERSLALYQAGSEHAATRGILIADTKFEWGLDDRGELVLIDEVFTPDSSRFWPADKYTPGKEPPSFDKQFVRDFLNEIGFDRQPPGPLLPTEIVRATRERYIEAYTRLTGKPFAWE